MLTNENDGLKICECGETILPQCDPVSLSKAEFNAIEDIRLSEHYSKDCDSVEGYIPDIHHEDIMRYHAIYLQTYPTPNKDKPLTQISLMKMASILIHGYELNLTIDEQIEDINSWITNNYSHEEDLISKLNELMNLIQNKSRP